MATQQNSTRALFSAIALGTVFQVGMAVVGHSVPAVANLFAVLGIAISVAAGFAYAVWAKRPGKSDSSVGGAIAGGACAMIGILASYFMGDVVASVLVFGTLSSAIGGAIGGVAGHIVAARSTATA